MKVFSIYKATNKVNGKIYIGFDSNWPKRIKNHKNYFNSNKSRHYNSKFHNAIRKYGWEAFEWEVICQSLDGEYLLNEMEPYFIQYYDSYIDGYNMTLGGEGRIGYITSEETKRKMSLASKGKSKSKKHIENISKGKKGVKHKKKRPFRKKGPRSESTKQKIRNSMIGIKHTEERRKNQSLARIKFFKEHGY